ncbi:efflux RND transporter periplasmic adaptor subunit [Haloferula chungangensis]|uniref:Efflux RND transporter periplasmic adaptor subunit n=1 Tax=Haloferula chungangensis TaxID=1048331 RepID=A0ABW2L4J4_9BACT
MTSPRALRPPFAKIPRRISRKLSTQTLRISLGLGVTFLSACKDGSETAAAAPKPPAQVVVYKVETRPFADTTTAVGTLRSNESVEISAAVTEQVEALHFEDGQTVKKGDLLATLTSHEEIAQMANAKAILAEEERELKRLSGLSETGSVAKVTVAERTTRGVLAKAGIDRIQAMLDDRNVRAPFDGVVGLRRISVGATVSPGTVITTLDQLDRMKLDFTVPEVFISQLGKGSAISVRAAAYPDRTFEATVENVDSRVDPVTRSITVRSIIDNKSHELLPGMLMSVNLQRNQREAITVPERALVPLGKSQAVFRLKEDSSVERIGVQIGARVPGFVEITEGLKVGDQVISDGVGGLSNGAAVKVSESFSGPAEMFNPSADAEAR